MSEPLEFYFDFMSPFAYLARGRVVELAREFGRELRYIPIDLPAAKRAAGNTGPANRDIPVKLRYLMTDIHRWAARRGLPVAFPASLDSHRMNAGTFYAIDRDRVEDYVRVGFELGWGEGADLGADATLTELARRMDFDTDAFLESVSTPETHAGYAAANERAHARGVFGVPTILIGDEMWWGNDRLHFVEEHLRAARG